MSNARLKLAKRIKQILRNTLTLNFCYLKIIHILHQRYYLKIYSIKEQKNKCFCIPEIIRLIIMKMRIKIKNRSNRYDINRPRSRHGHKYSKYKKCLSMAMLIYIKQQLGKSSVHKKFNQHWDCKGFFFANSLTTLIKNRCTVILLSQCIKEVLYLRWNEHH